MNITFLETSDMHGYVSPTDYSGRTDLALGTAKVSSKLKELRAKADGPVITIENGDFIQGSPLSYYLAKEYGSAKELTDLINQMSYDVQVLGNHEFNYGVDYLEEAIKNYQAPILGANMVNKNDQPYFGNAYKIIEKVGVKIAILGLTTQYIPHWEKPETLAGITFKSIVETAKEYVPLLRKQADLVIVSYHGGFEKDLLTGEDTEALTGENEGYELLQQVEGIDALFTGHQHRKIAETVHGVPVVQPGYRGEFIGEIRLTVEKKEGQVVVTDHQVALHSVEKSEPDPEILAAIVPVEEKLEKWLDQPLGKVNGNMRINDPMQARLEEHPYVEFINSCTIICQRLRDFWILRYSIMKEKALVRTITMRDVITNYIYPNTLAVIQINGADLRAALEQTAIYLAVENNQIVFNPALFSLSPSTTIMTCMKGFSTSIDMKQPVGQRITELRFKGHPVLPQQMLEVVTNQYRAIGGGNYAMFGAEKIVREIQIDMTELIADYLIFTHASKQK